MPTLWSLPLFPCLTAVAAPTQPWTPNHQSDHVSVSRRTLDSSAFWKYRATTRLPVSPDELLAWIRLPARLPRWLAFAVSGAQDLGSERTASLRAVFAAPWPLAPEELGFRFERFSH